MQETFPASFLNSYKNKKRVVWFEAEATAVVKYEHVHLILHFTSREGCHLQSNFIIPFMTINRIHNFLFNVFYCSAQTSGVLKIH